jgi:hypothetical protein
MEKYKEYSTLTQRRRKEGKNPSNIKVKGFIKAKYSEKR